MNRTNQVRSSIRVPTFFAILAALFVPALVHAQQDANFQRGFAPEKLYSFGNLDSVNLFNGNLTLTIPLGRPYAVNGALSYGLTLVYNSKVWDITSAQKPQGPAAHAELNRFDNAGVGWRVSLGQLMDFNDPYNVAPGWVYIGPDGSEHTFYPTMHIGDVAEPVVAGVCYTRDGSYLRLTGVGDCKQFVGNLTAQVEFPDGTVHQFRRASGTSGSPFTLTQMSDRFGNAVTVTQGATLWTLSDGHRTQRVYFKTVAGVSVVDRVELAGFGGAVGIYTFGYAATTISESCHDVDPDSSPTRLVPLLTSVALPAGAGSFLMNGAGDYYASCSDGGVTLEDLPGVLRRLKLPTLGKMEWTYQNFVYPTRGVISPGEPSLELTASLGVKTKTVLDAAGSCVSLDGVGCSWTYTQTAPSPTVRTTRVSSPAGDETVNYFNTESARSITTWTGWEYGLPYTKATTSGANYYLSQEIFDGPAVGGIKMRSLYLGYEHDKLPGTITYPDEWTNTNRRVVQEKTVFDDDNLYTADVVFSQFDGLGHYRRRTTGGTLPSGSNVRTEHTAFNPGSGNYYVNPTTNVQSAGYVAWGSSSPWVLGTSTESWAQEGSATVKTQTCFEPATGFLGWARTYTNGTSPLPTDVLVRKIRDGVGNVTDEQVFGGDRTANLPATTQNSGCTLSGLPGSDSWVRHTYSAGSRASSRFLDANGAAMSFLSLDLLIDAPSGLPSRSTDPAGILTDFEYDALGRLTWVSPTAGQGAWTEYAYAAATSSSALARVTLRQRNGSKTAAVLAESEVGFDAFGRPTQDKRKLPGVGWTTVTTRYNSMGWVFDVTERMAGTPTTATKYMSYDPFGRPQKIRPADSTSGTGYLHDVNLLYVGVRRVDRKPKVATSYNATTGVVTETQQVTQEFYDRQGRLQRVVEPSVGGAAATQTTYGYDPAGRLTQVTMGVQTRTFSYDGRGFLKWENHPEKTANVYGAGHDVDYLGYDALGRAARRIDGVNDLSFTYDRAGRLTLVRETGAGFVDCVNNGGWRCIKSFTYGTSSPAGNWKNGKLETAARYNYAGSPFFATVVVAETYTYGGVGGRASQKATQMTFNGAPREAFAQSWNWDPLGNVATLGYPQCTHAWCVSPPPRTVTYGYTDGGLTSIAGFTGTVAGQAAGVGITYHQNGMVNQMAHANGVTDTQGADPNGMKRPASQSAAVGATIRWSSGTYAYDGSGNVVKTGTAWYVYDELSRLKTGTVFTGSTGGGTQKQQTYAYDAYGNLTNIAGNPDPGRATPTSTATNRLTGGAYDGAGNLTSWNGAGYAYDALNMMIQMLSGAEDWRYAYTADDERFWSYRVADGRTQWNLRDLDGKVLRRHEPNASGTIVEDYVYRDGQLFAAVDSAATKHFHLDHLGTPRLITNAAGTQTAYHVYYPYGEEATAFNQDTETMKFTGHERDLASLAGAGDDLDYMHARFCSPLLGRFLSFDPVFGASTQPQSWNRYAYARGNPLKYADSTGLYVTNCASDDKSCLENAAKFEVARKDALEHSDEGVRNAALAYGDPGDANGVTVVFGDPGDTFGAKTAAYIQGHEDGSFSVVATVTVRSELQGTELIAATAHEGQHLLDARAFAATFSPTGTYDITKNQTMFDRELGAYRLTHSVYKAANQQFSTGCSECTLGRGVRTSADRDLAIKRILADPSGNYGVTPQSPGARQFPEWQ